MAKAPWYKRMPANFISDPYVQAMSAAQQGWFDKMLDLMWLHTPQGFLPNDKQLLAEMLAKQPGYTFEEHGQIVMDRFKTTEGGKFVYHERIMEQVQKLSKLSETRTLIGKTGGLANATKKSSKRVANAKQLPTEVEVDVEVDKSQNLASAKPSREINLKVEITPISDTAASEETSLHKQVRSLIQETYKLKNAMPTCPWDGQNGRQLKKLLESTPQWTVEHYQRCIANLYASDGFPTSTSPGEYIAKLPKYLKGPTNEFGRSKSPPRLVPAAAFKATSEKMLEKYGDRDGPRATVQPIAGG